MILTHIFAGRGAYPLIGAHFATIMTANIAHVLAPAQKRRLQNLRAVLPADEADAKAAGAPARSTTNIWRCRRFFMLSGHAPLLFAGPDNGVVAVLLIAGFFLIRRVWLKISRGLGVDGKLSVAAAACLTLAFALSWPGLPAAGRQAGDASEVDHPPSRQCRHSIR